MKNFITNEKILELAEKSSVSFLFTSKVIPVGDRMKNFSDSIVIECAEFIERDQGTGYELANRLKQYFGIDKS